MPKRILVVEDHPATRSFIKTMLETERPEPFVVVEAGTGAEALKTVDEAEPFDMILLDVNLPDMVGYEVCRALRSWGLETPVVFVTAKSDLKDFAAGREAGGDSYLVKPVARASLRSIVNLLTSVPRIKKKPVHGEATVDRITEEPVTVNEGEIGTPAAAQVPASGKPAGE